MAPESDDNLRLEIGHVLFIDIVGYSKLLIEEQKERLKQLTEIVLATAQVRDSTDEKLVRLPTGDGMALVFRHSVEEPARCALEISKAVGQAFLPAGSDARQAGTLALQLRMGIHKGPVSEVTDVSGRTPGGHYPLGPIAEEDWVPFVRERFAGSGKKIARKLIHSICDQTQGHPFYTQHLCHAVWELCRPGVIVGDDLLQDALGLLLQCESYAYSTLWESLAMNQRRFLKGIASETGPVKPFAGEFVRRSGLGSPSNAQRAVDSLLERDIIDRENGSFIIIDRFFRLWV